MKRKKFEWMLTKEDFIKESLKIHGNKYIYDKCARVSFRGRKPVSRRFGTIGP